MTKKRLIGISLVGLVLLGGILAWVYHACYYKGLITGRQDLASYVRALTLAALTMHRDHLRQSPETYHLLVWSRPEAGIPGVTFHEVYPWRFALTEESCTKMTYLFVRRYNRVAVMRACSDVLHKKCTRATRYVLEQGERLYPWVRRVKLYSLIDKALKDDKNARDVFKRMIDFYFNIVPYKFYLEARVLGTESIDFGTLPTNESFGRFLCQ